LKGQAQLLEAGKKRGVALDYWEKKEKKKGNLQGGKKTMNGKGTHFGRGKENRENQLKSQWGGRIGTSNLERERKKKNYYGDRGRAKRKKKGEIKRKTVET